MDMVINTLQKGCIDQNMTEGLWVNSEEESDNITQASTSSNCWVKVVDCLMGNADYETGVGWGGLGMGWGWV